MEKRKQLWLTKTSDLLWSEEEIDLRFDAFSETISLCPPLPFYM